MEPLNPEAELPFTGGDLVCQFLLARGVSTIFGYPGGAIMPFYDALMRNPVRHVLVRHESAAGYAADGYARVSGGVGVCVATSGPGATNLATPMASAFMDSIPVVAITGQVNSWLVGTDAFQENNIPGMFLPVTKWCTLVTRVEDLLPALEEGFLAATSGRPGPVLIDICKDVQAAPVSRSTVPALVTGADARSTRNGPKGAAASALEAAPLASLDPATTIDPAALASAAELVASARRPLILAGHGVLQSGAGEELRGLAELWSAPVATTLLGLGSFPEDHPLALGMMGMHGDVHVNQAIDRADLLLAVGMRFDDRVTGDLATYARNARVIHVERDAAEVGKNVTPDVALVSDARAALAALLTLAPPATDPNWRPADQVGTLVVDHQQLDAGAFVAAVVMRLLDAAASEDAIVVTDVGQHQMWQAQHFTHRGGRSLVTSGGCGAMGFALGAAIGAKSAAPDREVWAVMGDGGFQMASQELATLAQEGLDINLVIVNNGYLGMVRQWQEFFFEQRYSFTRLSAPNFARLAEAHGLPGFRAVNASTAEHALDDAKHLAGPVVIDMQVLAEDNVYPMIAPGKPITEMIVGRES